ncbi:MAG: sigma-70 family RNA polymerase sigma factor [Wenzhouxiangellaceae bacterium]
MRQREPEAVTQLLHAWRDGEKPSLDRLLPLVHDQLHQLAQRHMARERPGHTLQATALVNEAFLCLIDAEVPWQSRAHFYAVAAQAMRHILVDYAKARQAQKRGGDLVAVTLNEELVGLESNADILELHDALERLSAFDVRKSRIVELTYFAGLSYRDIAEVLEIGEATVGRELRMARAWLLKELDAP